MSILTKLKKIFRNIFKKDKYKMLGTAKTNSDLSTKDDMSEEELQAAQKKEILFVVTKDEKMINTFSKEKLEFLSSVYDEEIRRKRTLIEKLKAMFKK